MVERGSRGTLARGHAADSLRRAALTLCGVACAVMGTAGCLPEPEPYLQGTVSPGDTGGGGGADNGGGVDSGPTDTQGVDTRGVGLGCKTVSDCKNQPSDQCRVVVCKADGTCGEADKDDNSVCDDANPCTPDDRCQKGKCTAGKPKDCDDANACTTDSCESADGTCKHAPTTAACEDGEVCTKNEACKDGACNADAATWACQCKPNVEATSALSCAKLDPVDKCKGSHICQREGTKPYFCAINPQTEAVCQKDEDTECLRNWCDPKVGKCALTPVEIINKSPTVSPKIPTACNDENGPCTTNDACSEGECKGGTLLCECTSKDLNTCLTTKGFKNDPCKGQVYCANAGKGPIPKGANPTDWTHCAINPATVATCADANDSFCGKNLCVVEGPLGVCKMTAINLAKPCDDGNACTANDQCASDGKCAPGGTSVCLCKTDADCADKEDGNACNGTMFCNQKDGQCALNPATVVATCPSADDTACVQNICFPSLGVCKLTPSENIFTETLATGITKTAPYPVKKKSVYCEDGDECTPVDECVKGACVADDTNTCNCTKDAECAKSGSGDLCQGKLYCDKAAGKCKINPATKVTCSTVDDTVCAKTLCDPKTGACALKPVTVTVYCDDGDPCTAISDCQGGKCAPGTQLCPCAKDSDCAAKEDGDVCNGTLFCNKALSVAQCQVNPATVKSCSAANNTECLANTCAPKTGKCEMAPVKNNQKCDIGDPCLASPVCQNGTCFAETNLCQCGSDADCLAFDTGNLCSGKPYCDKTVAGQFKCKVNPATIVSCQKSDDACVDNLCDKATGKCALKNKPNGFILCDDGNSCTAGDTCSDGTCAPGTNVCGCSNDADCLSVDDGNPCNGKVQCLPDPKNASLKYCQVNAGTVVSCEVAKEGSCLISKCLPSTGKCELVSGSKCSDLNNCTLDTCDAKTDTCVHTPVADGSACDGFGFAGICVGDGKSGSVCAKPPVANAVYLRPSTAFRGCPAAEAASCKADEKPQHEVEFTKGIWYRQFETTVADYDACVLAGDCKAPALLAAGCTFSGSSKLAPITCVTPAEAVTYCTWLAKGSGKTGRLPTEAEFERAIRGGCELFATGSCKDAVRPYAWGVAPQPSCSMAVMQGSTKGGCDSGGPLDKASRPNDRSLYDIFDLAGNVSEWVADTYSAAAYSEAGSPAKDPLKSGASAQVIRGGNYNSLAADLRAGARSSASAAGPTIGFRCVVE